ncbi:MAG: transglutaminase domain-containing protein [Geminicoccaceae bacterium]
MNTHIIKKKEHFYLVPVAIVLLVVALLLLLFGRSGNFHTEHGVNDTDEANSVPQDAGEFISFLERRIDENIFECADLSALDRYACLIFQSALAIESDTKSSRHKTFLAIETMNIVSTLVSSARYSLIKRRQGDDFVKPGTDAELCIEMGYGLCGNHAATALSLLERLGIEARAVQFFYGKETSRASHIAIEANIDGWRYFDTTWGAFWYEEKSDPIASIMAVESIVKGGDVSIKTNEIQTWALKSNSKYDVFEYFRFNPSIIYGYDDGVINISNPPPSNNKKFDLAHIPRYIGDNIDDGSHEGISYAFPMIEGLSKFHIRVGAVGGCKSSDNKICVNNNCKSIEHSIQEYEIEVHDASRMHLIAPNDRVCYIQFDETSIE